MTLAQGRNDRELVGRYMPSYSNTSPPQPPPTPSRDVVLAALRAQRAYKASQDATGPIAPPTAAEAAKMTFSGSWSGVETSTMLVPWFLVAFTFMMVFVGSGGLMIVSIAALVGALLNTGVVLWSRYKRRVPTPVR